MEKGHIYNYSTQERINLSTITTQGGIEIKKHMTVSDEVSDEVTRLTEELEFYKSLFKSHINSVVFNLHIKKINGKNVWVDPVRDDRGYIRELDKDKDVEEWLKPVRPSR